MLRPIGWECTMNIGWPIVSHRSYWSRVCQFRRNISIPFLITWPRKTIISSWSVIDQFGLRVSIWGCQPGTLILCSKLYARNYLGIVSIFFIQSQLSLQLRVLIGVDEVWFGMRLPVGGFNWSGWWNKKVDTFSGRKSYMEMESDWMDFQKTSGADVESLEGDFLWHYSM